MRRFFVAFAWVITSSGLVGHAGQTGVGDTDGVVYIASNSAANEILVFDRNERGSLSFARAVPTGALGTARPAAWARSTARATRA